MFLPTLLAFFSLNGLPMGPVAIQDIHSTITLVWGELMEKTSRVAGLTRARHSALNSHWGGWNWQKITGLGEE